MATVLAEVRTARASNFRRRNLGMFEATFTDASRAVLTGKWFHGSYLADKLTPGLKIALYGKVEFDSYSHGLVMMHPEFEIVTDEEDPDQSLHTGRIVPVYEAAGKIPARVFRGLLHRILESLPGVDDPLPPRLLQQLKLPERWSAIRSLHFPEAGSDVRL